MAIKISGTTVIDDSQQLSNILSLDTTTETTIKNAAGGNNLGDVVTIQAAYSNTYYDDADYIASLVPASDVDLGLTTDADNAYLSKFDYELYYNNVLDQTDSSDLTYRISRRLLTSNNIPVASTFVSTNNTAFYEESDTGEKLIASQTTNSGKVAWSWQSSTGTTSQNFYSPSEGPVAYPVFTAYDNVNNWFWMVIADNGFYRVSRISVSNGTSTNSSLLPSTLGTLKAVAIATDPNPAGNKTLLVLVGTGGIVSVDEGVVTRLMTSFTDDRGTGSVTYANFYAGTCAMDNITFTGYNGSTGRWEWRALDFGYNGNMSKGNTVTLSCTATGSAWYVESLNNSTWSDDTWNSYTSTTTGAYVYDTERNKFIFSFNAGNAHRSYTSTDGYTWTYDTNIDVSFMDFISSIKYDANTAFVLTSGGSLLTTTDWSTYQTYYTSPYLEYIDDGNAIKEMTKFFAHGSFSNRTTFNDNNGWYAKSGTNGTNDDWTVKVAVLPENIYADWTAGVSTPATSGDYFTFEKYSYDTTAVMFTNIQGNSNTTYSATSSRAFIKVR